MQVTYKEGEKPALSYEMKFFETSAKDDVNVDGAFDYIVQEIMEEIKKNSPPPQNISLNSSNLHNQNRVGTLFCPTGWNQG